jgi:hypothetical protein
MNGFTKYITERPWEYTVTVMTVPRLVKRVVKWLWGSLPTAPQPNKTKRTHYMRLNLRLPEVKPEQFELPKRCPSARCKGKRFYPR